MTRASPSASPLILVVGPYWVGDMVMAQSLFKLLKQREPAPRIQVLAPDATRALLAHMPEVEAAIPISLKHDQFGLAARWRIARGLRAAGYDQAILLRNSWTSALIPWLAGIPLRTGWLGELRYGLVNDARPLDPRQLPRTVQRFTALGQSPGLEAPPPVPPPRLVVEVGRVQQTLEVLGLRREPGSRLLALCPGAEFGPAKRWPTAYFGDLAKRLHQAGWEPWLLGSAKDRPLCQEVERSSGGVCQNLAGCTSLSQAVELLSLADLVVSNDSGLMHVAAALERPLLALFGSSDPRQTPPLSPRARVLYLGLGCSPCFRRSCPLGHLECLRGLTVEQVLAAVEASLQG